MTVTTPGHYRPISERRHIAHEHFVEGRIYYRFHPRFGDKVQIKQRLEYRGVELAVIVQPDSSLARIPAWMMHETAAQYTLSEEPHFSVDILRSLRAAIDALLGFLHSESRTEKVDDDAPIRKTPTKPIRRGRTSRRVADRSDGRSGGTNRSPTVRDRDNAGKWEDRR
jgi:hypothetical protein